MTSITDQTNDPGFATLRVVVERFPHLRELSKTANLSPSEYEKLPDSAFAWSGRRQFPIHNKEHTALSVGYSKLASILPSDVQALLEKAAELYDVNMEPFAATFEKEASNDYYLLEDKRRFKVASKDDVQLAEQVYLEKYATLTIEDRAEAGFRLMKIAEHHQVSLHPSTQKLAGFTLTSTRKLRDWIEARREASIKVGSALAETYDVLAREFRDTEPYLHDRSSQVKLARLLLDMDKKAGLTHFYGKQLPDPLQTVFNTEKPSKNYVKVGSALQNTALLNELPLSFWQDTLGPDIAQEIAPSGNVDVETLMQILPTLPADLRAALETQLAAYSQ